MTYHTEPGDLKTLPLEDLHERSGAKFGGFAGWRMPITYPAGVLKEHLHCREAAGLFDISHMKLIAAEGADAAAFLSRACPLDAAALEPGQSKYTFLLNDEAGIIDDLIVTRLGETRFMIVANAGNAARDIAEFQAIAKDFAVTLAPLDRVFIAVQGPQAATVLGEAGVDIAGMTFMHGREPQPGMFLTRSGYTGEDGFEIGMEADMAGPFVEKLLTDSRVQWIGLAARDSLRLESGLCLHGNDLSEAFNPAEAGLLWAIGKAVRERAAFRGASALNAAIAAGVKQRRHGLKPEGRQPVRGGAAIKLADGTPVGTVTSGGFGPSVNHPVAMGYVATGMPEGTALFAEVRGALLPLSIHPLPFFPHRYVKG